MNFFKALLTAALFALAPASTATRQTPTAPGGWGNRPPTVKLKPDSDRVVQAEGCTEAQARSTSCGATSLMVRLTAEAADPDGDRLLYTYLTDGGKLNGDGPATTLDLKGVAPGLYTVTVEVDDGRGGTASDTTKVTVNRCACPPPYDPPPCPTVDVSCPSDPVRPGTPITFTVKVSGGGYVTPTFNWTVSAGTISSGQGTSSITVDTSGLPNNSSLTGTVDVSGYDRSCESSDSCTTNACGLPPESRKVDEYGVIPLDDEKARLKRAYEELRNDPTAQGYLICYGG
ncbi:MAG: PKD domain-containing protein, partial [Pyrinomonadaceae bacterium]